MLQDIRFALRMISAHRWFSLAVIATLALGIGLNTMVFTLVDAVFVKPLAVKDGDRLVVMMERHPSNRDNNSNRTGISYPDFRDMRAQSTSFERLEAGAFDRGATLSEQNNPPQTFTMTRVSAGLFDMLGIPPVAGRGLTADDDRAGAEAVVLLGYSVWKDRYGASPDVIGRSVRLDGNPATIVGVMPENFKFPQNSDLWVPLVPNTAPEKRTQRNLQLYGIRKLGVSAAAAAADLDTAIARLAKAYPDTNADLAIVVETFHQRFNAGPIRVVFSLMQAAVGFVLLIACANVANMMLSRAIERRREISIRAAMGASRWQIVRQLLVESTMLSVAGGVAGLALCAWGVRWFRLQTQDIGKPYWIDFSMDYRVFAFFAVVCIGAGLIFGLVPALRASRVDLNSTLKEGSRAAGIQGGGRLSGVLVVFQVAATLVLLTGAGIFVRAVLDIQTLNRFVPSSQLLTSRISLPTTRYKDADARLRFYDQLLPQIRAIPGVTGVALSSSSIGSGDGTRRVEIEGQPQADPQRAPQVTYMVQTPDHFALVEMPVLAGRNFTEQDGVGGVKSTIISKALAERFWPRQEAVGKRLRIYDDGPDNTLKAGDWLTVVGVCPTFVQNMNVKDAEPVMFVPYRQETYSGMALIVRAAASGPGAAGVATEVRQAVQRLDQDLALTQIRTLAAQLERNAWMIGVFGKLFFTFAFIALSIASVGLYAVIAQATTRRTQEIGIRMALGATSARILRMVMSRGALQLAVGLALGLAAAFPVARVMTALPFHVATTEPIVFLVVGTLLSVVGLFACWLPARRAAAVDPMVALRDE